MNMNDLKLAMGERIRLARESKHLSRAQLAELVHLSTKFISDIENGAKGMSLKNFILITQALDTQLTICFSEVCSRLPLNCAVNRIPTRNKRQLL